MIILGVDPGTAITGWGIVEFHRHTYTCIDVGVITTPVGQTDENRLMILYDDLRTLIKRYKPQAAAIEKLFFNTNAKTALLVGQARGVIMLAIVKSKIPIYSYTPLQVKIAITGYGRAEKRQMQEMVKTLLKLDKIPRPDDAADALAVALTHGFSTNQTRS